MPPDSLVLLHLADLRFSRERCLADLPLPPGGTDALLIRLAAQIKLLEDSHALRPNLVVLSGDLTAAGLKSEFAQAMDFVEGLADVLRLPHHRVLVLPGRHDVNHARCAAYFHQCLGDEETPQLPYWPKWQHYAHFFEQLYRDCPEVTYSAAEPWTLFELADLRLVIAALNSTLAESHRAEDHYGWLGEEQLSWFAERLAGYRERGWRTLAALHHAPRTGPAAETLRDHAALSEQLGHRLDLLLHGHADTNDSYRLGKNLPVLAAGCALLPSMQAHRWQLLRLRTDELQYWTACYDAADSDWQLLAATPRRLPLTALPGATNGVPDDDAPLPDPALLYPELHSTEFSDFLLTVEAICRLREPSNAEIVRLRTGNPPLEYLRVTVNQHGMTRQYPVLTSAFGVDERLLERCLILHRRYRQSDPGIVSYLVYHGADATPELLRQANEQRLRLLPLREYRQVLDFSGYLRTQNQQLAVDPSYPQSLYVPQRMRYRIGREEFDTKDGLLQINQWLHEPAGRFLMILGEFGTGKTFMMRQLTRQLSSAETLTPILVQLRALEKSHSLDGLIAQHLAQAGMERINLKAFRYLLEQGLIVLLFDGFDELALRITYARAADHFRTLIEAAAGLAKVVVTSRKQHFESDRQIDSALSEQLARLPGSRIVHLERFDPVRIQWFLLNRLGDGAKARERFSLIDRIKDLMGLSGNPRMLSFIVDLPEEDLRKALARDGEITSAGLYRLLLKRWLSFEYERVQPRGAPPVLSEQDRWDAVTHLALTLWQRTEAAISVTELTADVARAVESLADLQLNPEQAAHQVGSGTLLVRDSEGRFSFIHQSILEWLVAQQAAAELRAGGRAAALDAREMSPLMVDFLADLAGREQALAWAQTALAGRASAAGKKNALLLLDRLKAAGTTPLKLAGQDLRGRDLSERDLEGADFTEADLSGVRLRRSRLHQARLPRARLMGADLAGAVLTGADLRGADLRGARLSGADLRGAHLTGADLRYAKLIRARFDPHAVPDNALFGCALPQLAEPTPTLAAVSAPCTALAFSPDSQWLASAHSDGRLYLWDASGGLLVRAYPGHAQSVAALAFSPDGRLLAAASQDRTLSLWRVAEGQLHQHLHGHSDAVQAVAFIDAATLVSGALDGSVRLWRVADGQSYACLTGHSDGVLAVAVSPDRQRLVSASLDHTLRLWSARDGQLLATLTGHNIAVGAVTFAPNGQSLVSGAFDGMLRLWRASDGQSLGGFAAHRDRIRSLALSRDSTLLLSSGDERNARLWFFSNGQPRAVLEGHSGNIAAVAISPDGQWLASGGQDRTIRLWHASDARPLARLEGQRTSVAAVAFSPEGGLLASAAPSGVRLWSAAGAQSLALLGGHDTTVLATAFSPAGGLLASAGEDRMVCLWDVAQRLLVARLEGHEARVLSVAFSPDGSVLASASADGSVRLRPVANMQPQRHMTGIGWAYRMRRLEGHEGEVTGVAFSPDGQTLATVGADRSARLWTVASGRQLARLSGQRAGLTGVTFSPDGETLATASLDRTVWLWAVGDRQPVLRLEGHDGGVTGIAFSPTGNLLASGAQDRTVRLWDLNSGTTLHCLIGHSGRITGVAFSPDGLTVASAALDNTVRLWDVYSGRCLVVLAPLPEGWVAFKPDGRYKAGGDLGGGFWHTAGLCRFEPGELDGDLPQPLRVDDDEPFVGLDL